MGGTVHYANCKLHKEVHKTTGSGWISRIALSFPTLTPNDKFLKHVNHTDKQETFQGNYKIKLD